ncbi:MAG TPA: M1 family metallopeptidase, partial [Acidimicrobiales bacterium]|nr:M1 family metallopeptidase [Acidimicrobiales bacterium]
EAEAMFDVLTYEKGGSVLRMLEQYLGPEVLRKGIAAYLAEHRYGNTETTDLWDAIEATSGEPVRSIMDSWIFQGGYPLVSVALSGDRRSIELRQRRFLYGGGENEGEEQRWSVPVNLRASAGGRVRHERTLLSGRNAVVDFDEPVDWVVVNEGGWGFYRVAYSDELSGRLVAVMDQLDALERIGLVGDLWARVVAGSADLRQWVEVVTAMGDVDDPDVWLAVLGSLDLLDVISSDADRPALAGFVRRVAGPILERMGWDPQPGEDPRRGTFRSRLIAAMGILGADEAVREEASRRFARYLEDRSSLHPDVVTAVVHVAAAAGDEETYEVMRQQLHQAVTPQDQLRYLHALGQTPDRQLLGRTLAACLTNEVRSQDAPMLVGRILGSRHGRYEAWEWIEGHWDDVCARFPNNILIRMMEGATSLVDERWSERALAWLDAHAVPGAGVRQDQLVERIGINTALAARVGSHLAAALDGR